MLFWQLNWYWNSGLKEQSNGIEILENNSVGKNSFIPDNVALWGTEFTFVHFS